MFLVAPEHVRLATRIEQMTPGVVATLLRESAEEMQEIGAEPVFEDRTGLAIPLLPGEGPPPASRAAFVTPEGSERGGEPESGPSPPESPQRPRGEEERPPGNQEDVIEENTATEAE